MSNILLSFSGPTPVSGCERCPSGSFSLGGGVSYSSMTNAWSRSLPPAFDTECDSRDANSGVWVNNCLPWASDASGGYVMSGNNSNIASTYNADRLYAILRLTATFVRPGNLTFQFKVDAEPPYDGLIFMIDGIVAMTMVSTTNGWAEVTYGVNPGSHVFVWKYSKNSGGDWGLDQAAIRLIEFTGTRYIDASYLARTALMIDLLGFSFADTSCLPCGGDMTRGSRRQCRLCDANQYAGLDASRSFTCFPCPFNSFAPAGSMSIDSCVASRPCDVTDMAVYYTPCANNKRNVSRVWARPMTCNVSLPSATPLPVNEVNVECGDCTEGYYPDSTGVCQTCADGQVIDIYGNYSYAMNSTTSENSTNTVDTKEAGVISLCARCPPGTISIRSQLYGIITRRGWSLWPAIVDNVTAVRSGWKLTEQGITRDTALNPQWLPIAPLLFSTLHANRGVLEINYTLSGIPTTPGNKAWLELYVNDVQVAIANPSTNGTFLHQSQLSPRLDGNSTLAVLFVWRTGSAAADKASNVLIRSVKLSGTVSGGTSGCGNCPTGYQPTANQTSCGMCPAGSAATILGTQYAPWGGGIGCTQCPSDTFSVPGSTICRVKQLLMDSDAGVMYNLTALQALVDPLVDLDVASGYLPVSPVNSTTPIVLNATTATLIGVFRPIVPQIPAQYVVASSSLVNTGALLVGSPQSYVVGLAMSNTREAGSSFLYNADRFGLVQCTVPPVRSKITRSPQSTGERFTHIVCGDVAPLSSGRGVRATYSLGSLCSTLGVANNYGYAKTSIEFICDPAAVSITQPVLVPSSECNYKLTWTTAAACPLCDLPLFTPTKSACSLMGNQTVTYVPAVPCVGGRQPPSLVTVQTCASITLDQQTAGIAAGVVFLILLLIVGLIVGFVVVYRKYKATLLEFMYLKGQVTSHEMLESGSTRSADGAYEFDQKADTLSPEASVVSDEADEEEEVNIKPKANVVM
ncbi:hypothetical protein AaE_014109 [Aphanomyces astaci]|uniref:MRH domain-containing protein n=1 Tax=Aphanomyces astaci TaxID=112090 RepID=A0A6A4Z4Z6_APHAT|nr:hypothetical protein AaE_014109 [Aphanomyces astaci]